MKAGNIPADAMSNLRMQCWVTGQTTRIPFCVQQTATITCAHPKNPKPHQVTMYKIQVISF